MVRVDPSEIDALRRDYFDGVYAFGQRLRCAVGDPQQAAQLWKALDAELARRPDSSLGAWIALAYRAYPPAAPFDRSVLAKLDAHPHCSVRTLALRASPRVEVARRALGSSCYQLQAEALQVLQKAGQPVPADTPLPAFLR